MSWHYSQALVEEYLEENSLDGKLLQQLNTNPTPQVYLSRGRMKAFSRLSRSGMTFKPLMENLGEVLLTWYLEDFLVKTSVPQEKEQDLMEQKVQCGTKCLELSKKYNQSTLSLKTAPILELKGLLPSYKDLPKQGMMLRGMSYLLKTAEQTTSVSECGFLLPKPTCAANQLAQSMQKHLCCRNLTNLIKKTYPTPTCHNAKEGGYLAEGNRNTPTLGWQIGGKPHPLFTEWMMRWPSGWTDLKPLEMDKFQLWQQGHFSY